MRATYATLLLGILLAATMLVPFDYATRGAQDFQAAKSIHYPDAPPPVPPGKVLVRFPDYWHDALQRVVYDNNVYLPGSVGVGPSITTLRTEAGDVVAPGARWMYITIDAQKSGPGTTFDVEYLSADDRHGVRQLRNNETFILNLEEPMNDWAPDPMTRWSFRIYNDAVEGIQARVLITIMRPSGPLPSHLYVADKWGSDEQRIVYDQRDVLRQASVGRQPVPVPDNKGPAKIASLRNVPATELRELSVHLYYNSSTPTNLHFRPLLSWNSPQSEGAGDQRNSVPPTAEQRGASGHFYWKVPVTPEMYDNILGTRSRWQLSVNWYGNSTDGQQFYMDGNFRFLVLAERGSPDLAPEVRQD